MNLTMQYSSDIASNYSVVNITTFDFGEDIDVDIYDSEIHIDGCIITASSIDLMNATGYIINSEINETDMSLSDSSSIVMNETALINGELWVSDGYVELSDVSIEYLLVDNMDVEYGEFDILDGLIVSATGRIRSGVYSMGNVTIDTLPRLGTITVNNATLNITNTTFGNPYGYYFNSWIIARNNSIINLSNVSQTSDVEIYMDISNDSKAYIYSSSINYVYAYGYVKIDGSKIYEDFVAEGASVEIYDSEILQSLQFENSTIVANYTVFQDIDGISGVIHLYSCNVTDEFSGGDFMEFVANASATELYVWVENSNISGLHSLSAGEVHVENSTIESIFSAFQKIYIVDSNISLVLNISLFKAGTVTIENNIVVSGSYECLLNISGSSNIGFILEGVSILQDPYGAPVELEVWDSTYFATIALGGSMEFFNSSLKILFANVDGSIGLKDTIANASDMGDVPAMLLGDNISLINSILIYSMSLIHGESYLSIKHTTIYSDEIYILNSTDSTIEDSMFLNLTDPKETIIMNSFVTMNNVTGFGTIIYGSEVHMDNVVVSNGSVPSIVMSENSRLYGTNVSLDSLVSSPATEFFWYLFVPYPQGGFFTENISVYLENPKINNTYLEYYYVDNYYGVVFDNETITGDYDVKTNYTDPDIAGASPIVIFEVNAYGKAKITRYKGDRILRGLLINTLTDTSPPEIVPLNASYIEYEYGVPGKLCYLLTDDESPTEYIVEVNGTQLTNDTYSMNYELCVDLEDFVTSPATYVVDVYIYDSDMNMDHETTIVKALSPEAPTIELLNGTHVEYEYGMSRTICFRIFDENPDEYIVLINGSIVTGGTYSSGETICIDLQEHITQPGHYIINITATDDAGQYSYKVMTVDVYPMEPPSITSKPENEYTLYVGDRIVLNWTATDRYPATYRIYLDGMVVVDGSWSSGQTVSYMFEAKNTGEYNVTIVFSDMLGQKTKHTVIITVKTTTATGFPPLMQLYIAITIVGFLVIAAIILLLRKRKTAKIEE